MRKIDDEIQALLSEHRGDIRSILKDNHRLDLLYALSSQRELLLEWYDFEPEAEVLQVGADYGALTGLLRSSVSAVTVLDETESALETVRQRYPGAANIYYRKDSLAGYAAEACAEGKKYDYVIFAGTLTAPYEKHIHAAKSLLKPDGILIVALANALGMKYFAGTVEEENALTKRQLAELLCGDKETQSMADESGTLKFYYPMPDYKTPVSIYSDAYLPKKGDLTRVTPAYDYPPYHLMEQGEKFDTVCEAGLFDLYANSYLVFWSADPKQLQKDDERIFIKYNKTRREEFQIKTCICERDVIGAAGASGAAGADATGNSAAGKKERYVEKAALSLDGSAHIASFKEKYEKLTKQHRTLKVAEPKFAEHRNSVFFPYLVGETCAEKLGEQLEGGQLPLDVLQIVMNQIYDISPECRSAFVRTADFDEVFGADLTEEEQNLLLSDTACEVSNIDALFENMLMTREGIYCLDYEWVFLFPVPEHFVKYRILYYFYEQYSSVLKQLTLDQILGYFGITPEMAEVYRRMEENFQSYVHGENQELYLGNYMVYSRTVRDIRQTESDLARARERIEQMKIHSREKDVTIRKITEVQRLTNNHVTNLEAIIHNHEHEIGEMAKTLNYLNKHEAILFKIRRKLGDKFNQKYPKGSVERKKLHYKKEYMLHPLRSMKLYSTPEGRNLRDGDFNIGEIYREHGRLKFEQDPLHLCVPAFDFGAHEGCFL